MGCCFCCLSEDAQIQKVLKKMEICRVKDAKVGHSKFFVGRIALTQTPIYAPISNLPVAYYELDVEHLVTRQHQDEQGNTHTTRTWEHLLHDQKCSNFILSDPEGPPLYVPGELTTVKFYTLVNASGAGGGGNIFQSADPAGGNEALRAVLQRHGVATKPGFFGSTPEIRYREGCFSVNEICAVLGTVSQGNIMGCPVLTLSPCQTSALNEAYFQANQWESHDIKSWEALTATNSLIGTDDPQYMKGVTVPQLPMNYSACSFAMAVGPPMMMMQPL